MKIKLIPIMLLMVIFCAFAMAGFNLRVWVEYPSGTSQADAYVSVQQGGTKYEGYTNKYGWIWFYNLSAGEWYVCAGKIGLVADTTVNYSTGNHYITLVLHFPD